MVVSIVVANFLVKTVFIDKGSLADLLYLSTLERMVIPEEDLKPFLRNLIGFFREQVGVRGYIDLLTPFGAPSFVKTISIRYLVVNC